jgi:ABC-type branched-subunit amino acid transport system ATPase component
MTSQVILSTSGATKRFGGVTAVNNVDFSINRGEVVGILGPNGAGKISLICWPVLFNLTQAQSIS